MDDATWGMDADASQRDESQNRPRTRGVPPPWAPDYLTLDQLLGPLPFAGARNAAVAAEYHARVVELLQPCDILEQAQVRDFCFWSLLCERLRPDVAAAERVVEAEAFREHLKEHCAPALNALLLGYYRGEDRAVRHIERALSRLGLSVAGVRATAVGSLALRQLSRLYDSCVRQATSLLEGIVARRERAARVDRYANLQMRRRSQQDYKVWLQRATTVDWEMLRAKAEEDCAKRELGHTGADRADETPELPRDLGTFDESTLEISWAERPKWIADVEPLKDLLQPLPAGVDWPSPDVEYLYRLYASSLLPQDVFEEGMVRHLACERLQQDQLQRHLCHWSDGAYTRLLLETLEELAPGDGARLMQAPDGDQQVFMILGHVGLTSEALRGRALIRGARDLRRLHANLIEADARSAKQVRLRDSKRAELRLRARDDENWRPRYGR